MGTLIGASLTIWRIDDEIKLSWEKKLDGMNKLLDDKSVLEDANKTRLRRRRNELRKNRSLQQLLGDSAVRCLGRKRSILPESRSRIVTYCSDDLSAKQRRLVETPADRSYGTSLMACFLLGLLTYRVVRI